MQCLLRRASAVALSAFPAVAQQGGESSVPQQPQQEVTPQELARRIEELERKQKAELLDLQDQIDSLEEELEKARKAATPPQQGVNAFNPQITVFGNFLARADDQHVFLDGDPTADRIDDTMSLREAEIDFRAAIDPWADGVLILSSEAEVPGEFDTGVEEGYFVLKKLPLLDSAPGGLKLKIGRFRPAFGTFNKIHLHDLPSTHYPNSFATFLGEDGYIQDGISGQFFLPPPSASSTLEGTLELLGGGDLPLAEDARSSELAGLGHVEWFNELTDAHSLALGASGWTEGSDRSIFGLDATWKWKPHEAGEWNSFLLGGEVFASDVDDGSSDDATGFFGWAQYQLDRNTYVGVRYDQAEELEDSSLVTQTYSTYLTYYTTEFLRFRVGLEHADSDVELEDDRNSAFLELNFVFGSHPVEPYWVNR